MYKVPQEYLILAKCPINVNKTMLCVFCITNKLYLFRLVINNNKESYYAQIHFGKRFRRCNKICFKENFYSKMLQVKCFITIIYITSLFFSSLL